MSSFNLEPQLILTTSLLEGLDGAEKMSKSLGNYVGVTESPDSMIGKILSISDDLMWKYYELVTDLSTQAIEDEKNRQAPMESKIKLANLIAADFPGHI